MLFLDLETQHTAAEVGGWANVEAMRMSVACTFEPRAGYRDWWESQAGDLLAELRQAEQIVGFNVNTFDYRVLALYGPTQGLEAKTFDIHQIVRDQSSGFHESFGLFPQFRLVPKRFAKHIPRRNLGEIQRRTDLPGLRSLPGSRGA